MVFEPGLKNPKLSNNSILLKSLSQKEQGHARERGSDRPRAVVFCWLDFSLLRFFSSNLP
jgi:hypothetical protein